ncbi:tol-pal system protein YbgF [Candidatus Williamhamiltonella defendens]|uniref:tol-pal system protein YbgF n=1 Tax=Candidatus Williamhamiltonella defendens TaxID=138072 RepID=UPI001F34879D|nr:tol-pal system protein YbgF [Candidatus Hamiltonella defensa]
MSLLIGALTIPSTTIAKAPVSQLNSESLEYRITQLERISGGRGQLLTEYEQKISDLQQDVNDLRGQIQNNQYEIEQIKKKQSNEQGDMSFKNDKTEIKATTLKNTDNQNGATKVVTLESKNDEKKDYDAALFFIFEKKDNNQAILNLLHFIEEYSESIYRPNAYYWLGQLFYNKGMKNKASYYYAVLVKKYHQSPKRPDAMLKVGMIMQESGKTDKAKQIYQRLIEEYPLSAAKKEAQKKLHAAKKN